MCIISYTCLSLVSPKSPALVERDTEIQERRNGGGNHPKDPKQTLAGLEVSAHRKESRRDGERHQNGGEGGEAAHAAGLIVGSLALLDRGFLTVAADQVDKLLFE